MMKPDFAQFKSLAQEHNLVPVWREFLFDTDTAVTAYAKIFEPPFGFLLESVVGGEKWARYTFLGSAPREALRVRAGRIESWTAERGWHSVVTELDPLSYLNGRLLQARPAPVPGLPRFFGGAVGYLAYDVVRYIERLPTPPPDPLELPEVLLLFTDVVLAIDNVFGTCRAIATIDVSEGQSGAQLAASYENAAARLEALVNRLSTPSSMQPLQLHERNAELKYTSSYSRAGFERDVERIRSYITAGDAFQVVLSQRLAVPLRAKPLDIYRVLRSLNPSPYMYLLEFGDMALVGSSPEVLVRVEDEKVVVRPIAGTRPRSGSEEQDELLAQELLADEKERAEHLMLVDLGRNDVGRVSRFGSVRVVDFMQVERYSHVLHMVSQVEGELAAGLSAVDVLRACFPAGTVSGAPKVRAMEIIDELEPVRRGPYAGAVGYFAYGGRAMDTAIAIRTLVAATGMAYVQAGAGVVADSEPAYEYAETLAKARALLRVLQLLQEA